MGVELATLEMVAGAVHGCLSLSLELLHLAAGIIVVRLVPRGLLLGYLLKLLLRLRLRGFQGDLGLATPVRGVLACLGQEAVRHLDLLLKVLDQLVFVLNTFMALRLLYTTTVSIRVLKEIVLCKLMNFGRLFML